jgi:large subunit ribosomal protein L2
MKTLKKYKPITPSYRQRVQINLMSLLKKTKPIKSLVKGMKKSGGRNNFGRLTCFKKGGGHKKSYRLLSKNAYKKFLPYSIVNSIEYDPFRSSFICCCFLKETGSFKYVIAPQNIKVGSLLVANYGLRQPSNGSPCLIFYAQVGDLLYNINLNNGPFKNKIACSAGTFSKIIKKNVISFYSIIKKPSGILYSISFSSLGFLGKTSNPFKRYEIIGKAGRNRWKGIKPSVRGVAMNPIDHPHGGGEGKSSGGRPSVTPWGFPTKGKPTKKKNNNKYIYKLK